MRVVVSPEVGKGGWGCIKMVTDSSTSIAVNLVNVKSVLVELGDVDW